MYGVCRLISFPESRKLFKEAYKAINSGKINAITEGLMSGNRKINSWWVYAAMELVDSSIVINFPSGEEYAIFSKNGKIYDYSREITLGWLNWVIFIKLGNDPWSAKHPPYCGYHATWGCNVPSILKEGLIPGRKKTYNFSNKEVVCFSEYKNICYEMLEESAFNGCSSQMEIESGISLLEISPWFSYFMYESITEDPNDHTGSSMQFHGAVPPEAIRVVE